LTNGGEQLGMEDHFLSNVVAKILFIGGWGVMAFSFVGQPSMKPKSLLSYGGALGIVIAVMAMKMLPLTEQQKKPFGMLFIVSWIGVAIAVGLGKSMASKQLGAFALVNVFGAMLYLLPKMRLKNDSSAIIMGIVYGLTLSSIGRFGMDLPTRLFHFTKENEYMVHVYASILYSFIFYFIVQNLNKMFLF